MAEPCNFLTFKRLGNNPEELCNADCMPGSDRCEAHQFDAGPHQ